MRVLVLAGEGPYNKNDDYLEASLFADRGTAVRGHSLAGLTYLAPNGARQPLLRPKRGSIVNLTAYTLEAILQRGSVDFEMFSLQHVWDGDREPAGDHDVVFLSTTFICDRATLRRAVAWIDARFPAATLVLGGQYSNLKYAAILRDHPRVDVVVRGDGEHSIPALLDALGGRQDLGDVPNVVLRRGDDALFVAPITYVDIEAEPSPFFPGEHPVVPYESMRGCPFRCKFCSFPAASPEWRYKSAIKIREDWHRYAVENGARHIRAMDSTFTVPPRRLTELLPMLVDAPFTWEGYTRANSLRDESIIQALEASHCRTLSIGFESMSPSTLDHMNKKVTAHQNRRAHDLLAPSDVGYRVSFMVGYPGETPEDYEETHRYLVEEYTGHFMLSVFSLVDETMPVWDDSERFQIEVTDPDDPDYAWKHIGMTVDTARQLLRRTLDEVRAKNDDAVLLLWQSDWTTPLIPDTDRRADQRLQKLVERYAMAPVDVHDPVGAGDRMDSLLDQMRPFGVDAVPDVVAAGTA